MRFVGLCIVSLFLLLLSCESEEEKIRKHLNNLERNLPEQEIIQFAHEIEEDLYIGNYVALNERTDFKSFIFRGIQNNTDLSEYLKDLDGNIEIAKSKFTLYKEVSELYEYHDFLHSYQDTLGFDVLIFQFYGNEGLTFIEFTIAKLNSTIYIIDIRNILIDGYLSKIVIEFSDDFSKKSSENDNINPDDIIQIKKLLQEGNASEAYSELQKIPLIFRENNQLMEELELAILIELNEDLYIKKLENKLNKIENNKTKLLQKYLIKIFQFDYYEALDILDLLSKEYPNSWIIHLQKGNCYDYLQQFELAINEYKSVLELAPKVWQVKDYLFVSYFELKEYSKGLFFVEELLNLDIYELNIIDEYIQKNYETFHQSKEYQDWKMSVEETSSVSL